MPFSLYALFARLKHQTAPLRLLGFLVILALVWLPFALPLAWLIPDPNWDSIVTLLLLYGLFITLVRFWIRLDRRISRPLNHLGLTWDHRFWREGLLGLGLGSGLVWIMFGIMGLLGWVIWLPPLESIKPIALSGLGVGLGIGFAEELLFRGWMLAELRQDYGPQKAAIATALLYAVLHFLKPLDVIAKSWPEFLGLVLMGVIFAQAKDRTRDRLGLSMGLHAGLVWGYYLVNVGQLTQTSGQVADWVTGIGNNPLAGLVGLGFLTALWVAVPLVGNKPRPV